MFKSPASSTPGTSVPGPLTPLCALFPPTGALEIGQALPIHASRYTCTARSSAGVAHKHVVLTVQGKHPPGQTAVALGAGKLVEGQRILREKRNSPPVSSFPTFPEPLVPFSSLSLRCSDGPWLERPGC